MISSETFLFLVIHMSCVFVTKLSYVLMMLSDRISGDV